MANVLHQIQKLVRAEAIRISAHGYDELADDGILVRDVMAGIDSAVVVEQYPSYPKGPSVLALQNDRKNNPIHVVWGIPKGYDSPAVVITAYRPDPGRWSDDFLRRR